MKFTTRRRINAVLWALCALILLLAHRVQSPAWGTTREMTGWLLLLLTLGLASFGWRKRIKTLPLGKAALWLQFHLYGGLLALWVFFLHVDFMVPQGQFEFLLAFVFLGVAGSGILGILLSRILPRQLTNLGEPLLYERIPLYRRQLSEEAREVEARLYQLSEAAIFPSLSQRLQIFLTEPRSAWRDIVDINRHRRKLEQDLRASSRYYDEEGRNLLQQLTVLVRRKQQLDLQESFQWALRAWLFIHIPLSFSLLLLLGVHVLLVLAFHGGF